MPAGLWLGGEALGAELAALAARLASFTVAVHAGAPTRRGLRAAGQGSGIVWRADGLVVTNAHVARTDHAVLTFAGGRRAAAAVVARDPARDLALLRAEGPVGAAAAAVGDAAALAPGALVFAFGHPLGTADALAAGVVHASGEAAPPWLRRGPDGPRVRVVQADVRLLPGNSGGPLADAAGRVVGVNAMVVNGLGVAIAASEVERLVAAYDRGSRMGRAA